jgi:hypothetical protein
MPAFETMSGASPGCGCAASSTSAGHVDALFLQIERDASKWVSSATREHSYISLRSQ